MFKCANIYLLCLSFCRMSTHVNVIQPSLASLLLAESASPAQHGEVDWLPFLANIQACSNPNCHDVNAVWK